MSSSGGCAIPFPLRRNPRSSSSAIGNDDNSNHDHHVFSSCTTDGDAAANNIDIATRLNESCWVSDDEGARRTPVKSSPSRSMSFSVGITPAKQYPTRFARVWFWRKKVKVELASYGWVGVARLYSCLGAQQQ